MKGFPDIPPVWLGACLAGIWSLDRFLPSKSIEFESQSSIGWIFIGVAFVLVFWSGFWFRKKRTSIEPHHQATELVVEGPYRVSRNPIYLALIMIAFGMIVGRGVVLGLPVLLLLSLALHTRFVLPEEQGLRDVFGEQAEAYFQKTRRWI